MEIFTLAVSLLLLFTGTYFTFSLRLFSPFRFPKMIASFFRKERGDGLSPLRAVSVALAGTLGVGNIVGVSSAILTGGAGAIFWMWIGGIIATPLKYAEIVLAVKYRKRSADGYVGGAGFYMTPLFAIVFSALCVAASFAIGNFLQMNTLADTLTDAFGIPSVLTGVMTALLLIFLLFGGIRKISRATGFLVPCASALYTFMCLFVIVSFRENLGAAFRLILSDAFSENAFFGGVIGFLTNRALRTGISRGLITNEAGCGTAPAAHACTSLENPCEQGFYGVLEVFIDTIVLCSLTAFSLLTVLPDVGSIGEMQYVILCFSRVFGSSAGVLLAICIFLFAVSTLIGWSYYGVSSLSLIRDDKKSKQAYILAYSLLAIFGAVCKSDLMWKIADLSVGIMTIINLFFLIRRRKEILSMTDQYFTRPCK